MTSEADTAAPAKPAISLPWRMFGAAARSVTATGLLVGRIYSHFARPIGFAEVLLIGGAALVGAGLYSVSLPAALIAPGVVFIYVAIAGVK